MTEPASAMYEHSVLQEATSIDSVLRDVQQKEQRMIAKRRFLMGLPLSKTQKEIIQHHQRSCLPESLVRDNDIFCEKVKMDVMGAAQDPITAETTLDVGGALHAVKILARLKDLPTEVLLIMSRKLKGERAATPLVRENTYKSTRMDLIDEVRRKCMQLLSSNKGDELLAPLARALEIARLSLKQKDGHHNFLEKGFVQVEEKMRRLQTEISVAIKLANEKVKVPSAELSSVLSLLDPNAVVKERRQRTAVKKLLEEYLFECSFMKAVPEALEKALAVIHKSNEAKREGILSLSATMKQVLLDTLPDHDFGKDYEELGKSEKEDDIDDVCDSIFDTGSDSDDSEGSIVGDYVPADFQFSSIIPEQDSSLQHVTRNSFGVGNTGQGSLRFGGDVFSQNPSSSKNSSGNSNMRNDSEHGHIPLCCPVFEEENSVEQRHNTYLGIQEACDNTSFIASNLIKRILKGVEEGVGEKRKASMGRDLAGPVIIQAVEELVPSVSNSTMQKLKDLDRRDAGL